MGKEEPSSGLGPDSPLSSTGCFGKTYLKQFYKHSLLSRF
jgi:hypothetical protein